MTDLNKLQEEIQRIRGRYDIAVSNAKRARSDIRKSKAEQRNTEKAKVIIQTVAQKTQEQLEYRISELVTLAMKSIFPEPYEMHLDFVKKRDKTEAEITFSKDGGEKINPMNASGGGVVDVAAFALRVTLWSLQNPKSRNVIILDEPFRFLSTDLQPKAGELLKEISERLGIQFIIITHEEELVESADKVFTVRQKKGVSVVKTSGPDLWHSLYRNLSEDEKEQIYKNKKHKVMK